VKDRKTFGRTKIICTIGPASQSVERLVEMIDAGMDVARLNFSHGTHEDHLISMNNVREAARRTGEYISILQDLCGPKIRTGALRNKTVALREGEEFTITVDEIAGDERRVTTTYPALPSDVKKGDSIILDDGKIALRVLSTAQREVVCTVEHGGVLGEHKGMNLPGVRLSTPSLTEKDIEDVKFGLEHGVDYVALSFIRSAEDVRQLRKVIEQNSAQSVPVVAKIEKKEAVDAIDAIIASTDALMVARGDLGVEMMPEDVPILQKMMVHKCNEAGVPVIIATQMLESMIENPRPTRAEASDVANAVLDGTDAVMLSAETSIGKYPVESVRTMESIICRAEGRRHDHLGIKHAPAEIRENVFDAVARAACVLARQVNATAIVPITHSGATARRISKYRPESRIITVTGEERVLRFLNLVWGVRGVIVKDTLHDTDTALRSIIDHLKNEGYVVPEDFIVFTAGIPLFAKGSTDTIKVQRVE
jgi:pyruvate kinase